MKLRNYILAVILFICLGIILLIYSSEIAAYVSFGFASMLVITYITTKGMETNKVKKLDSKYFVLTKENLLIEYEKLAKEFDEGKLKQVTLTYLKLKEDYDLDTLKRFGLYLTKNYNADPSGFDDGIIVLFVNIHKIMMNNLLEHLKEEIKKEGILIDFDYGYAIYKKKDEFEALKTRAINNVGRIN